MIQVVVNHPRDRERESVHQHVCYKRNKVKNDQEKR
jgi:hypothetical protein